ncbi:MAG: SAM-dependent methyltransferase [Thermoplasmata archaeon]
MSLKRDSYYWKAKSENYRSRASYKLLFLDDKFHLLRKDSTVLEIGSSPGGWSQIIRDYTDKIVSVDIEPMIPVEGVTFIKMNIFNDSIRDRLSEWLKTVGSDGFDTVLSDAMGKTSGDSSRDHGISYEICERVMKISIPFLHRNGDIVVKQFQGDMTNMFIHEWLQYFREYRITKPPSSRERSREIYILFRGFK